MSDQERERPLCRADEEELPTRCVNCDGEKPLVAKFNKTQTSKGSWVRLGICEDCRGAPIGFRLKEAE